MVWTYETVSPTLIANLLIERGLLDGVHKIYRLTPNEGYVMHDKNLDREEIDPDTLEPTSNIILGFYAGTRTVAASYDFTTNPREFYAVLETEVPSGAEIFNITPEHEIRKKRLDK